MLVSRPISYVIRELVVFENISFYEGSDGEALYLPSIYLSSPADPEMKFHVLLGLFEMDSELYLEPVRENENTWREIEGGITFLDDVGNPIHTHSIKKHTLYIGKNYAKSKKLCQLLCPIRVCNDSLRARIELKVKYSAAWKHIPVQTNLTNHHIPELLQKLEQSDLDNKIALTAGGTKVIGVHKSVLVVHSPVLAAMLPEEGNEIGVITMEGITEETLKALVDYFYTLKLPETAGSTLLFDMLAPAEQFQIAPLKSLLEEKLCERLTPKEIGSFMNAAIMFHCEAMLQFGTQLIQSQGLDDPDWVIICDLMKKHPGFCAAISGS